MTNTNMPQHLFVCDCHSLEHQLVVSYFPDDDDFADCVYVSVHLAVQPWHQRLWTALKYLFGHQSNYGAFDEILLNADSCRQLGAILMKRARCCEKKRQGLDG